MQGMFWACTNTINFNLENYDTSHVTDMSAMFRTDGTQSLKKLDLSNFYTTSIQNISTMFYGRTNLAILDISNFSFSNLTTSSKYKNCFTNLGTACLKTDGAYADGIPYVYVKDATAQNWVLTYTNNGRPNTWTTDNVIIKNK